MLLAAVRNRVAECSLWRRVPRCSERVLSALELRSGHTTARPVSADAQGRQPLSSIVVSSAPSIEHAVHRGVPTQPWLSAPLDDEYHAVPSEC